MGVLARKTSAAGARQNRVVLISRRWDQVSRPMIREAMVAKKPGTPGRARIRRQTIAQGMPAVAAYLR
jgi:hypothetical protein